MFGFGRKKKKDAREDGDTGLQYAGPAPGEPEAGAAAPRAPGKVRHLFDTDRGTLEMRDDAMVLLTKDGDITVPYHQVEAWDDSPGKKKFRVWWRTGGAESRDYGLTFVPRAAEPADISRELREIIHRNTFVP